MSQPFWVYLLRCADGAFYVGHTDNLEQRLAQHNDGRFCRFTQRRRPVQLVWSAECTTRDEAKAVEAKLKGWSRAKKQALLEGDYERLSLLSSRGVRSRALRDGLRPPQERGSG